MTDDADFPYFKPVIEQWRVEYGRIRKLGGGDYWVGCRLQEAAARSEMSPYALGLADHLSMREAVKRGDKLEPLPCPFDDGTPEKAEYNRGWDALPPRS
ncbi:MAG TPA: hypothetical protein VNV38_04005 [Stellaceae bacterium]|jgi:hypothetical protein|nr:hypothetical protein [Stellaceae bacterium]